MTVTEIKKELQNHCGAILISNDQLAAAMGYKSVNSVKKYTHGLPKIHGKFFVQDVAERIKAAL